MFYLIETKNQLKQLESNLSSSLTRYLEFIQGNENTHPALAKIIAIVIPVLKEHVDEGLITYDEIHVMDNQTTPNFKSVASLYSKQLGLLESSEDIWKFVINLPKELMDTENWPKYNHGGEFTYQDIEDVLQSPPKELEPKENEEPEEKESIYDILKQQKDQKLWATFQGFLDWIHIHYNTEKKYETKARKAIFYVQAFDNRLKITPESSGIPIFLSKNESLALENPLYFYEQHFINFFF